MESESPGSELGGGHREVAGAQQGKSSVLVGPDGMGGEGRGGWAEISEGQKPPANQAVYSLFCTTVFL